MGKAPSFQFYPGDWLKDPALSMCSPATRGIWMDLLCAAHELARSGQITGTPDQIARACRCTAADLIAAVNELQSTGTADVRERRGIYTITNRRMRREFLEREDARARQQKRRGNGSNLPEIREEKRDLKAGAFVAVSASSQTAIEARKEDLAYVTGPSPDCHGNVTSPSSSSSSSSLSTHENHGVINTHGELEILPAKGAAKPKAEKPPKDPSAADKVREVFAYWQVQLNHPAAKLTPARHRAIETRLREGYTVADLKQAIDGCLASPFHQGKNDQGTVYDDIELICRNGQKVEMFIGKTRRPANGVNGKASLQAQNEQAFDQAYEILFGESRPADAPTCIEGELVQ